jgi:cellulose synthase/poly-beta-1,6-N-acetylglucosamine synthase-like glycosyltransferase
MIFSVIVPFLNEEIFIERCLQALLQQSFDSRDYEIICIDNGSTDGSLAIVHRYPVTVLHESRQDPYLARNCGIRAARGRFLAFTDADCIVDRHWLAGLHQHLEGTDADIVLGRLLYPAPTPASLQCYEQYYHTKLMYIYGQKLMPYYYGHAGNMAVRAPVFQQVGLFSGMPIVGDTEIIHNLLWHRPKANITYAPEAKAVHAEVTRFRHCMYKLFQCGLIPSPITSGCSGMIGSIP